MSPSHSAAGESVDEVLEADNSEGGAEAVDVALESVDSARTAYRIRTLSQRIVLAADDDTA